MAWYTEMEKGVIHADLMQILARKPAGADTPPPLTPVREPGVGRDVGKHP